MKRKVYIVHDNLADEHSEPLDTYEEAKEELLDGLGDRYGMDAFIEECYLDD